MAMTLYCFKEAKRSGGFPNALGCRPFFTEKEPLALFPGVQNPPETPSAIPWKMTALRLRRKESRSSMTMRAHLLHFILISAPVRMTVHSSEPHGWGLRVLIISPIKIISLSIIYYSRGLSEYPGLPPVLH